MNKKTLTSVFFGLAIYLISTGGSYAIFSNTIKPTTVVQPPKVIKDVTGRIEFDQGLPKTEPCPLNGQLYSKKQREWWEKHRPLGVMIENHEESRPQSGVSFADVVYEAVAEGGITRFLSVFYCQDAGIVGPVRSARTYFLDYISEYGENPLYTHVGGANTDGPADALQQIEDYDWYNYNDLSQFNISYPDFFQDRTRQGRGEVATEHSQYSKTTTLWEIAKKRGLTNKDKEGNAWDEKFVTYTFKDDVAIADRPGLQTVHIGFWKGNGDYEVDWKYDKESNTYKRANGGKPFVDKNTNKQLTAKTIVVLEMDESRANDGYEGNQHLLYDNKGTGSAIVFMDGKEIEAKWKKANRTARTLLFDKAGKPIQFNKGKIWFIILPSVSGVVETQ